MKNSTFILVMAIPVAIMAALSSGFKLNEAAPGLTLVAFMVVGALTVWALDRKSDAKRAARNAKASDSAPHS